ncbi:MAG TPA: IPTL-CTERM sorting domain-containing protein [Thermoanaerobaculia bacterium]|nr:IPTL-CTERM sorting domain-containing protein [Thermoanaerobaculia bacterium]
MFQLPVSIAEIPTLDPAGLALLTALLGLAGWRAARRRRRWTGRS